MFGSNLGPLSDGTGNIYFKKSCSDSKKVGFSCLVLQIYVYLNAFLVGLAFAMNG